MNTNAKFRLVTTYKSCVDSYNKRHRKSDFSGALLALHDLNISYNMRAYLVDDLASAFKVSKATAIGWIHLSNPISDALIIRIFNWGFEYIRKNFP